VSQRSIAPGPPKRSMQIEARERKICTIAFIDVVQSTALIEDLDPEDALDRLAPAVELIMDTCEEFGASVRFVGDGALAAFGFPTADENHCIRAVEAGLAIIKRVSDMQADRVDIRVGLHTGPVLFGSLSHTTFDELTLTGPVVHLADKVQSAAKANTVTVSQAVIETVGEMFQNIPVGEMVVSGIEQPMPLFQIIDRNPEISRWSVRIGHGLSPFIGRDADLEHLNRAWASTLKGSGSVVSIVGEAGIGKSRLVHEFTGSMDRNIVQVLVVSASVLDKQVAYAPVTRALRHSLNLSSKGNEAEVTERVGAYLDAESPAYIRQVSALQSILESGRVDPAWTALGQKVRQEAIVEALLSVFLAMARQVPMVVIFEDMHWADQYTLALGAELMRATADHKIMVVLTARTPIQLPPDLVQVVDRLTLGPLDDPSSRKLIRSLLSHDDARTDLSAFIDEICGRTPLFIEEIIRNLKSVGLPVDGVSGQGFQVPESVQPLIAQRIDMLTATDRQTLQLAAVIGAEFSVDLLQRLLRQEGLEETQSLLSLARMDLLVNIDAPVARFRHALIQQVAYSSLPKRRVRHLHGLFVDIAQGLNDAPNLSMTSSLAFHAERSHRWTQAAKAYVASGHLSLERGAFDDSIKYFDRAISCASRLETDPIETATINMQARQGLRIAYVPKAAFSRILEISTEVERLAQQIGDDSSALGAGIDRVIMMTILDNVAAVLPVGEEMLRSAEHRGAPAFIATAAFALSQAYWFTGDFGKAAHVAEAYGHLFTPEIDRLNSGTNGTVSVLGKGTHANALTMMGQFEDARSLCDQMGDLAAQTGKAYDIAFHAISEGILAERQGDFEASRNRLQFATETSETAKIDVLRAFLCAPLARAHAGLGDFSAARRTLAVGHDIAGPVGMAAFVAQLLAAELEILAAADQTDGCDDVRGRLLELCHRNGYQGLLQDDKADLRA